MTVKFVIIFPANQIFHKLVVGILKTLLCIPRVDKTALQDDEHVF